ncbi:MAG TPA: serine/threonine-protein kinase, partial [Chloroflexota bacterium]|nr:serine/threonine-protein kinase [Chloroflexota bacterium]
MSNSAVGELVGRVIGPGGRYRLLAVLGKGGMATVYQAEQLNVPRQVAIKVAEPGLARLPTFARRFQQEVGALARLEHGPGILPVYDVGDEEGLLYLVMPLVTGGTLKDRLERGAGQPWPPRQALPLVQQVLDGLEFAHERGFIHRDVKPSNILLEGERVYLSDFGIAKLLQEGSDQTLLATLTGVALMGTPAYMAPEQALGLPADRRADVYAFGVVLYEMLTGRVPYQALTPMQLAFKHVEAALPPPRSLNPNLDPRLEAVLLRALARQPEQRFSTAKDFNEAYQQAVDEAYPAPRRVPTPLPAAGVPDPPDGTPSGTLPDATPAATLPDDAEREAYVQAFSAELFRRLERVKSQRAEWGKAEELNRAALLREAEQARLRQEQEARARAGAEQEERERLERERSERERLERDRLERERLAQAELDRQRAQQEQEARAALLREQRAREERERTERERRQRE